jgi:hypothetical protein
VVGALAGGVAAGVNAKDEQLFYMVLEIGGGILGGIHGAQLPDLLEPANIPRHRGPVHGWAAGAGATWAGVKHLPTFAMRARALAAELESRALQEPGPLRSLLLFLAAVACHLAAGYVVGAAAGYASHLLLDAGTPEALPLLVGHG